MTKFKIHTHCNYAHALLFSFTNMTLLCCFNCYFISSPEKSPDSSAPIDFEAAVGGVVGAMLGVVSVTAVVVLTVYCFMCARRKGYNTHLLYMQRHVQGECHILVFQLLLDCTL